MDLERLVVDRVSKRYGNVQALDSVSAEFVPGEVHGILGENGAGKSTLVGALAGFVTPTSGSITLDGTPLKVGNPTRVRKMGIELIHQHFMLVPAFTVLENLVLSQTERLAGVTHPEQIRQKATAIAESLGWSIPFDQRVEDLSVGVQQRVEILKSLLTEAQVMIFDEPTAVLGESEVEELLALLTKLKQQGKAVILIAHKLHEVLQVCDRFTVLRKGKFIATETRANINEAQLVQWMVGEQVRLEPKRGSGNFSIGLEADGITVLGERGEEAVKSASFAVSCGQILGLGGVDGNGQVELAECLAGIRPAKSGHFCWKGQNLDHRVTQVGYVPQDRQSDGLALDLPVSDNMLVGGLDNPSLSSGPFLKFGSIKQWAGGLVKQYAIKTDGVSLPVRSLSGGNQQKVIVGRVLDNRPDLLVVVNPTRGLDVKAAAAVHDQIRAARDRGAAILLISTDLDELQLLSDEIGFLIGGSIKMGADARLMVGGTV